MLAFVYFPSKISVQNYCQFLLDCVLLSYILTYNGYKYLSYILQTFSSSLYLTSSFSQWCLQRIIILIYWSPIYHLISFMVHNFCHLLKKSLPTPKQPRFPLVFFLSFIVAKFTFKVRMHVELIFMYTVRWVLRWIILHMDI